MRYSWIAPLIVVADVLVKLLLARLGLEGSLLFGGERLLLELTAEGSQYHQNRTELADWFPLLGLLVLFYILMRSGRGFVAASALMALGTQLAAGGVLAQVVDILRFGAPIPILHVAWGEQFSAGLGIGNLSAIAGVMVLLVIFARRKFSLSEPQVALLPSRVRPLDFAALPRGIDNVHIDVLLSPRLVGLVEGLSPRLVDHYFKHWRNRRTPPQYPPHIFNELRSCYEDVVRTTVNKAKGSGEGQLVELLHVALYKLLRDTLLRDIGLGMESTKEYIRRQSGRKGAPVSSSKLQNLMEAMGDEGEVYRRISAAFFQALAASDREKNGPNYAQIYADGLPQTCAIFTTPVFQATQPWDSATLLRHYVLFDHAPNALFTFSRLDSVLNTAFANCSQSWAVANQASADGAADPGELLQGLGQGSVLDEPENVAILLDTEWTRQALREARANRERGELGALRRHRNFQLYQQGQLQNTLESSQLLPYVLAANEVAQRFRDGGVDTQLALKQLRQLAAPGRARLNLLGWLRSGAERRAGKKPRDVSGAMMSFLRRFAHYRRDLYLFQEVQRAGGEIALQREKREIETSRANYLLNELVMQQEVGSDTQVIRHHAVLKADLRGSTRLTEQLVDLGLNPATHFANHFFRPINHAIQVFGAEKVFIEGDAVILILNEFAGLHSDAYCVSRACGLAAHILRIMQKQNQQLELLHLPRLELGIGIAYNAGSPNFIFDGDHRITISPAINRSDRLSACTWAAKQWHRERPPASHVSTYQPSERMAAKSEKAEKDVIYNINGIHLEPAGFDKLRQEVNFGRLPHQLPDFSDDTFLVGKFPDAQGRHHRLVLREAKVRVYDDSYPPEQAPPGAGRHYYEVIYDEQLLRRLFSPAMGAAPLGHTR